MKPKFQGIDNVYKTKADNKDIRDLLEKLVPEATNQMSSFAQSFRGATQEQTCKNIFNYIKNNFTYVADQEEQIIKLPSALLRKKVGDCKSYSLFTAGILSNLGIPYHFVYASYNDNPIPHHVYVETDSGCKIDVVYGIFNKEKKAKYKYKKNMNVRYMAGLGDCGCKSSNTGMGITLISKEKRQAIKETVTSAVEKVTEKAKDIVSDVKGQVKLTTEQISDKTKQLVGAGKTVGLSGGRALFLLIVKNNFDGIASKISLGDTTSLLNSWNKLGGNRTNLAEAIKDGASKPEKKLGFLPRIKKVLNVDGIGAFENLSTEQKTAITGICTAVGTAIGTAGGSVTIPVVGTIGGAALGTAVGASLGVVTMGLANELVGALKRTPSEDAPLVAPSVTPDASQDTGQNDGDSLDIFKNSKDGSSSLSKNLPYILGGLALLGAGYYFYTKKK